MYMLSMTLFHTDCHLQTVIYGIIGHQKFPRRFSLLDIGHSFSNTNAGLIETSRMASSSKFLLKITKRHALTCDQSAKRRLK